MWSSVGMLLHECNKLQLLHYGLEKRDQNKISLSSISIGACYEVQVADTVSYLIYMYIMNLLKIC